MSKKKNEDKGLPGRKREITNFEQLKNLMLIKPSLSYVALIMGCSERTVQTTVQREFGLTFTEFQDKYLAETKQRLVDKALSLALSSDPDTKILIHCLNNICDWKNGGAGTVVQIKNETNVNKEDEVELVQEFKQLVVGYMNERKERS